jgi:hypothetical protein
VRVRRFHHNERPDDRVLDARDSKSTLRAVLLRVERGCAKLRTIGSKKRSVLRNLLSQPARSASNQGQLHASFLT